MSQKLKDYIIPIIILISILISKNNLLNTIFWITLTISLLIKYGMPKDKNILKNNTIRIIIITILSYFIITYSLGIVTGYSKSVFSSKFLQILKNITIPLIIIISQEIVRFIYAKRTEKNIKLYIILTIIYIFLDITTEFNLNIFNNFNTLFVFLTLTILPMVAFQSLYSYLTRKVSLVPTIILRLTFNLYIYILPIFPDLGNYINSVLGIIYPYIVYRLVSKNVKYYEKTNIYKKNKYLSLITIPLIIALIIVTILVSGIFNYKMIAVGSGSMEKTIYLGDAVVYKKINNKKKISVGTIIAFNKNNKLITHRIIKYKIVNGKYIYKTKGDNNNTEDNFNVYEKDIEGIVLYDIRYIGYPTIWLNAIVRGDRSE